MDEEAKKASIQGSSEGSAKPNMGKAWAILIAVFVTGVAIAWSQNKILPVMTFIMTDLNVSAQIAGWINSIGAIVGILLAFPAAGLIRKWGVRISGLVAIIVCALGGVIGFFAPNEIALLIGRLLEGFGPGIIGVLAPSVIAMWFPIEKRGAPMGIWASWQMIAVAGTFAFTGMILGPNADWKNMYIVGFVCIAIALVLYALLVREPKNGEPNYADSSDGEAASIFSVVKSRSLWGISLAGMTFGIAVGVFAGWIPSYWDMTGAMDLLAGNTAIGYIYAGEAVACIVFGFILNKVKHRKRYAAIVSILYAIVLFAAYHTHTFEGAVIISIGYFICEGAFGSVMWALLPQSVPDPRLAAAAIAFFTVWNQLGLMIGVPMAGAILDATAFTGWTYLSIVAGACLVLAAIGYWTMKVYGPNGEVIE